MPQCHIPLASFGSRKILKVEETPSAHSASALKIQLNPTHMAIFTGIFLSGPVHHSTLCFLHMTAGRAVSTVIQFGNEWEVHTFRCE